MIPGGVDGRKLPPEEVLMVESCLPSPGHSRIGLKGNPGFLGLLQIGSLGIYPPGN